MTGIFDSHAHYDDGAFDEDRELLLSSLPEKGIDTVINCGSDIKSSAVCLSLSERYPYIFAACGVHGLEAAECESDYLSKLREFCRHPRCVAIGEIGVDYHYEAETGDLQLKLFAEQLSLAKELDLPVIVHDREAHGDVLSLLNEYRPRGVVHCFSGSAEMAKEVVKLGMYIGLGGAVTFKNARKPLEVAAVVPDDRLLIETDCPYMTPVPFRGKRNDSSLIPYTAEVLAQVRGVSSQQILDLTRENGKRLFGV